MTAKFTSSDKLSYEDCEYGTIVVDDEGKDSYTKEYELKAGYFTFVDGKFNWDGAADESCRDCVFERINFDYSVGEGNEDFTISPCKKISYALLYAFRKNRISKSRIGRGRRPFGCWRRFIR